MNEKEKKYLRWYQKVGYGFGDFGSNCFYTFVTSFIMIYLTNTVGLNSAVIGTLILVSKCFDGVTDVIFGNIIDKTHHKWGKARPWILFSTIPIAICEVLMYTTPTNTSKAFQYAYFFVIYTIANSIFYTVNNIAYTTFMSLITRNEGERVQITSFRYMFAMAGSIIITAASMGMVDAFGGGTAGWRMTAIVFSLIQVLSSLIVFFCAREIQEEQELSDLAKKTQKVDFFSTLKIIMTNKYYLLQLLNVILGYIVQGLMGALGVYYCTYVLGNAALLGTISMAQLAMVIGLIVTPAIVKKMGMHRALYVSLFISGIFSVIAAVAGFTKSVPLLILAVALKYLTFAPSSGCGNPFIAEIANNIYLKRGIHAEGAIFSCSSVGIKIGGGLASAIAGWILVLVRFDAGAEIQTGFTITGLQIGYLLVPAVLSLLMAFVVKCNTVIQDNQKMLAEKEK